MLSLAVFTAATPRWPPHRPALDVEKCGVHLWPWLMSDVLPFSGLFLFRVCCPRGPWTGAFVLVRQRVPPATSPVRVGDTESKFCYERRGLRGHTSAINANRHRLPGCNVKQDTNLHPVTVFPPLPLPPVAWCRVRPIPGGAAMSSGAPRRSQLACSSPGPHAGAAAPCS